MEYKAETLKLIKERLAEEPLLALSLRGFTKGELLTEFLPFGLKEIFLATKLKQRKKRPLLVNFLRNWLGLNARVRPFPLANGWQKRLLKVRYISLGHSSMRLRLDHFLRR